VVPDFGAPTRKDGNRKNFLRELIRYWQDRVSTKLAERNLPMAWNGVIDACFHAKSSHSVGDIVSPVDTNRVLVEDMV
jgi:hypothetical protein